MARFWGTRLRWRPRYFEGGVHWGVIITLVLIGAWYALAWRHMADRPDWHDRGRNIAFVVTAGILVWTVWQTVLTRASGALWGIVVAILFLAGSLNVVYSLENRTCMVAALSIAAIALCHVFYSGMTPAWGMMIAFASLIGIAAAITADYGTRNLTYVLVILGFLVLLSYTCANVRARTARIMVGVITALILITLMRAGQSEDAKALWDGGTEPVGRDAIVIGLTESLNRVTTPPDWDARDDEQSYTDRPKVFEAPAPTQVVMTTLAIYLLYCRWALQMSFGRRRNLIELDVTTVGRSSRSPVPKQGGLPSEDRARLETILLTGSIGTTDGHRPDQPPPGTPPLLILANQRTLPIVGNLFHRTTIRAAVRIKPPEEPIGDAIAPGVRRRSHPSAYVTIEKAKRREVYLARAFDEVPDFLPIGAVDLAGYAVLSHCLSARGMPVWSEFGTSGIGAAAWSSARESRSRRFDRTGHAPRRGLTATDTGIPGQSEHGQEIGMLEEALERHDPRSLLLMLELSSRYFEVGNFSRSLSLLTRAAIDFPQFPETWYRIAVAAYRLADRLLDETDDWGREAEGSLFPDRDTLGPEVTSHRFVCFYARLRSFRSFARRDLKGIDDDKAVYLRHGERAVAARLQTQSRASGMDSRTVLAHYYLTIGKAAAAQLRFRMWRGRLILRWFLVQSERIYFSQLLISRFAVRRLSTAARAMEVLCDVRLSTSGDPLALLSRWSPWRLVARWNSQDGWATKHVRRATSRQAKRLLDSSRRSVIREGTGWRGPAALAEAYKVASDADLVAFGVGHEKEDKEVFKGRSQELSEIAVRRCLAEHGWHPCLIDHTSPLWSDRTKSRQRPVRRRGLRPRRALWLRRHRPPGPI